MPFVKENLNQVIETKRNTDAVFKKMWDESREEYPLSGEKISPDKKNNTEGMGVINRKREAPGT